MAVIVTGVFTFVAADSTHSEIRVKTTDKLFAEIMESLPGEAKARVDSAGSTVLQKSNQTKSKKEQARLEKSPLPKNVKEGQLRDQRLEQLPEQLRLQVEKAISDIDKRREEKALEFKEINRKRENAAE